MKYVTLLSVPLLALAGFTGNAFANETPIATLKGVSGDVDVARGDATLDAGRGMKLFVSDRIVSAAGASAGIVFRDGTVMTLGPSADLQLRDYTFEPKRERFGFLAYLARGAAVYTSGLMGKLSPESVKVATPTATVGIRGTRFIIEAD